MNQLWHRAGEISTPEVRVLADVVRNHKTLPLLSEPEKSMMLELKERGFVRMEGENLLPTFVIMTPGQQQKIWDLLENLNISPLTAIIETEFDYIYERICRSLPSRLTDQAKFVTAQYVLDFRMTSLRHALEQKRIRIPDPIDKSTIAMYMILN